MTQKALEVLVRDLIKTVDTLVCKVSTLEAEIKKQSEEIVKLSSSKQDSSTRKILTNTPKTAGNATTQQRPQRTARATAVAAISELSRPASTKVDKARAHKAPTVSTSEKPNTDNATSPSSGVTTPTLQPQSLTSLERATKSATENASDAEEDDSGDNKWHVATKRRRHNKTQRSVVIGSGKDNHGLQAVERTNYIQAWQFKTDTTCDQVKAFLRKIANVEYFVEKRHIKSERHASFIIGMPESVYSKVTTPTLWPQGIRFANWFFRTSRSRPQNETK